MGSFKLGSLQRVFRAIPRTIGTKVKYSNISRDHRAAQVKTAIDLLSKAKVCHPVYHSHCSGVPLLADIKENVYKLIFMDIGMANHICGVDWRTISALHAVELVNEGSLAERFIGQHLFHGTREAPHLCYWLREARSSNAEVDYVISQGPSIYPVEVKAGKSGTLKSLQQFLLRHDARIAVRFDLNPPSMQTVACTADTGKGLRGVNYDLLSLPLYMVEELPRLLSGLDQ